MEHKLIVTAGRCSVCVSALTCPSDSTDNSDYVYTDTHIHSSLPATCFQSNTASPSENNETLDRHTSLKAHADTKTEKRYRATRGREKEWSSAKRIRT